MEKQLEFDFEKKKIDCEELEEEAWKWFSNLTAGQTSTIVIEAYMKEFGIREEDVNW